MVCAVFLVVVACSRYGRCIRQPQPCRRECARADTLIPTPRSQNKSLHDSQKRPVQVPVMFVSGQLYTFSEYCYFVAMKACRSALFEKKKSLAHEARTEGGSGAELSASAFPNVPSSQYCQAASKQGIAVLICTPSWHTDMS